MAAIRALCIILVLAGFFLVGTPLQWLVRRLVPAHAEKIPTAFCRVLLWLVGVRVNVEGQRMTGPVLGLSNHVSWIDILALGGTAPFCFLAKSEVARWPVLSAFAQIQDTVFVDRKRRRTILSANRQMAGRLAEGRSVLLFPEGTTIEGREPARFHSSHIAAARDLIRSDAGRNRVDVQPIAISYSSQRAAWVGDDDLVSHVWRMLRDPPLRCTLSFGAPIPYRTDSDRKAIAIAARAAVTEMLTRAAAVALETDHDFARATLARL